MTKQEIYDKYINKEKLKSGYRFCDAPGDMECWDCPFDNGTGSKNCQPDIMKWLKENKLREILK